MNKKLIPTVFAVIVTLGIVGALANYKEFKSGLNQYEQQSVAILNQNEFNMRMSELINPIIKDIQFILNFDPRLLSNQSLDTIQEKDKIAAAKRSLTEAHDELSKLHITENQESKRNKILIALTKIDGDLDLYSEAISLRDVGKTKAVISKLSTDLLELQNTNSVSDK